jgi:hypothetical protein
MIAIFSNTKGIDTETQGIMHALETFDINMFVRREDTQALCSTCAITNYTMDVC